jgi:hypothetical protein
MSCLALVWDGSIGSAKVSMKSLAASLFAFQLKICPSRTSGQERAALAGVI